MKEITFLNTINKTKKIAGLHKNLRVYDAEKKAVSLCYGPEVQGLSLLNGFEK